MSEKFASASSVYTTSLTSRLPPGSTTVKYLDELILLPGGGLASVSAGRAERSVTTFAEVGADTRPSIRVLPTSVNACAARIDATGQLAMWGDCLTSAKAGRPDEANRGRVT